MPIKEIFVKCSLNNGVPFILLNIGDFPKAVFDIANTA